MPTKQPILNLVVNKIENQQFFPLYVILPLTISSLLVILIIKCAWHDMSLENRLNVKKIKSFKMHFSYQKAALCDPFTP